jgi:hypothetical protein
MELELLHRQEDSKETLIDNTPSFSYGFQKANFSVEGVSQCSAHGFRTYIKE